MTDISKRLRWVEGGGRSKILKSENPIRRDAPSKFIQSPIIDKELKNETYLLFTNATDHIIQSLTLRRILIFFIDDTDKVLSNNTPYPTSPVQSLQSIDSKEEYLYIRNESLKY